MTFTANDRIVGPVTPADGVTLISVDFYFEDETQIEVYKGGQAAALTLGADYTVSECSAVGVADGSVTLAAAADGATPYSIFGAQPLERTSDLQFRGDLRSTVLNLSFDRLWRAVTDLQGTLSRSLRFSQASSLPAQLESLTASEREGKVITFDSNGDPIIGSQPNAGTLTVSAFAETLLDDATADAVFDTLGLTALAKSIVTTSSATSFRDLIFATLGQLSEFTGDLDGITEDQVRAVNNSATNGPAGVDLTGASLVVFGANSSLLTRQVLFMPDGTTYHRAKSGSEWPASWSQAYSKADADTAIATAVAATPFPEQVEVGSVTPSNAGSGTVAHGLTAKPALYVTYFECTTADGNYSVGDEIYLSEMQMDNDTPRGVAVVADATNFSYKFAANSTPLQHINKTTGAQLDLTNGSWRMKFRAWGTIDD